MIIPRPAEMTPGQGRFVIGSSLHLVAGPGAGRAAELLAGYLGPARPRTEEGPAVELRLTGKGSSEEYRLRIRPDGVLLSAAAEQGLFHGVQTLRQLLPPQALGPATVSPDGWWWPSLDIVDRPRLAWRGVLLDVARHFLPLQFLYGFVDQLALHKFNILQLHLTDDQGWRIEIPGWPRLTEVGAWRASSQVGAGDLAPDDATAHGGYYTGAELRGLAEFAAARGVTVVPEIEMPGHVRAALAAYPELGNHPHTALPVWTRWGISKDTLSVSDRTLAFCRDVLSRTAEVFPSPFLHIGGDECPTVQWQTSSHARERATSLGLETPAALHGWFLQQMVEHVGRLGRRAVSWDESGHSEGHLPPELILTAWRDTAHARRAIARGHQVVMAPHRFTYLDYPQTDHALEPAGQPGQTVTLADVYGFDPLNGRLPAVRSLDDQSPGVLGTQANLWTEYAPSAEHVGYLAYPRLCAMAEVAWSRPPRDVNAFQARLDAHQRRLRALGVSLPTAERRPPRRAAGGG